MLVLHPNGVARHSGLVAVLAVRVRDTGAIDRLEITPFLALHSRRRAIILRVSRLNMSVVANLTDRTVFPCGWCLGLLIISRGKRAAHIVVG